QRDRAEANFARAREAVDRYFTRVSEDRLLNEPHMEPLRKDLLESAREFYETFSKEHSDDPAVQLELGRAHLRLQDIERTTEGPTEAIRHAEQARATFAELAQRRPGEVEPRRELGRALNELGRLYNQNGRATDAVAPFREALSLREALAAETRDPGDRHGL